MCDSLGLHWTFVLNLRPVTTPPDCQLAIRLPPTASLATGRNVGKTDLEQTGTKQSYVNQVLVFFWTSPSEVQVKEAGEQKV
jgi:hypothetical protein